MVGKTMKDVCQFTLSQWYSEILQSCETNILDYPMDTGSDKYEKEVYVW